MDDNSDLTARVAALEECMNTHQADYNAALSEFWIEMVQRSIANLR